VSRWLAPVILLSGCLTAGRYPLQSTGNSSSAVFAVEAAAAFDSQPGAGSDLVLTLELKAMGGQAARVNLSQAWWKVDGVTWTRCRHGADTDKDSLIFNLEPEASRSFTLRCRDIPRPYRSVEFKFHTAGTGAHGVVHLRFEGIPKPL